MTLEADVLSPNALGAILDEHSIAALNVPIVAGGANNQLATRDDGDRVQARGILYAPDYVINAGGIINVSTEYLKRRRPGHGPRAGSRRSPAGSSEIWEESAATGRNPARGRRRHGAAADRRG